jgi:phosphoribosylamine--glycine ligase
MKVLIIGSGGREHALAWKIRQSNEVSSVYIAPGNPGIARDAEIIDIKTGEIDKLLYFAIDNSIDLTVVGPEGPLVEGIADKFMEKGLKVFGPSGKAAEIEGSKIFTRELLSNINVPQPKYKIFSDFNKAIEYIKSPNFSYPTVIKADGLAAGKGVIIAQNQREAEEALKKIMIDKEFRSAGDRVLIEEFLEGKEASFFIITDGKTIFPLPTAQDYKRIGDGDTGPNTGGMGCYSPSAFLDEKMQKEILDIIIKPVIKGMARIGREYKGFLYCGLMLTENGPKILEFNCRMGDPEAEVIIPRIKSDIIPYMKAVADNKLHKMDKIVNHTDSAVTVILASKGYPSKPETGYKIIGLDKAETEKDIIIYYSGVGQQADSLINTGGRVLAVTALGDSIMSARNKAYETVQKISFDGMQFRQDIALGIE